MKRERETVHQRGRLVYQLEETPPMGRRLLYAMQFVIIFIGSIVLVPMLAADDLVGDQSRSHSCSRLLPSLQGASPPFVQAKGLGPVGARLPILLGTTFVVITPLVAITTEYGYDAFLGAVIAGGVVYVLLAWFGFRFLRKLFSSTVSGTLVISIALTLGPLLRGYDGRGQ